VRAAGRLIAEEARAQGFTAEESAALESAALAAGVAEAMGEAAEHSEGGTSSVAGVLAEALLLLAIQGLWVKWHWVDVWL